MTKRGHWWPCTHTLLPPRDSSALLCEPSSKKFQQDCNKKQKYQNGEQFTMEQSDQLTSSLGLYLNMRTVSVLESIALAWDSVSDSVQFLDMDCEQHSPCLLPVEQRGGKGADVGAGADEQQDHTQQTLKVEKSRLGKRYWWINTGNRFFRSKIIYSF